MCSDHHPLLIDTRPGRRFRKKRLFRFKAAWMLHHNFKEYLGDSWDNSAAAPATLRRLQWDLKQWNQSVFRKVEVKKEELRKKIDEVQRELEVEERESLVVLERKLQLELMDVLKQEEMVWYQKSRGRWIEQGYRNIKYYHMKTLVRRKRNKVEVLKDGEGNWVTHEEGIRNLIQDIYEQLFYKEIDRREWFLTKQGWGVVKEEDLVKVGRELKDEEIRSVFFYMGPFMAPGEDRFQAVFYQKNWDIVGRSVCDYIKEVWRNTRGCQKLIRHCW